MRIALVAGEVHKHGGVPLCVAHLLENLCHEHQVTVFSTELEEVDISKVRFYKIPILKWPSFLKVFSFMVGCTVAFTILRIIRREPFDIVHAAGEEGGLVANVITSHFCQREELSALRKGIIRLPSSTLGEKIRALDYWLHRLFRCVLEWMFFGRPDSKALIVVSQKMKEQFVHHYGAPAEKIIAIPNGVDLNEFNPTKGQIFREEVRATLGLSEKDVLLLFIGRDWERKGLRYAVETLAQVPREDVKLVVVGMGDVEFHKKLARQKGVEKRVVFVTRFVRQSQYYAACDILLFPTLYEPFGLVIPEAMASGLPLITSKGAGAAELVADGTSGFLVEDPTNAEELAQKVNILVSDPALRQAMGRQGRLLAEKIPWEKITRDTLEVYRAVLKKDPEPRPSRSGGET